MTENNRFTTNGYKIYDTYHDGLHWLVNNVEANEIVEIMNNLDLKARERSKALSKLQKENDELKHYYNVCKHHRMSDANHITDLKKEKEQLKSEIIKVIDRKIKNNDKNPSQDFQVYSKVNRALKDVRENLRDIIEDF